MCVKHSTKVWVQLCWEIAKRLQYFYKCLEGRYCCLFAELWWNKISVWILYIAGRVEWYECSSFHMLNDIQTVSFTLLIAVQACSSMTGKAIKAWGQSWLLSVFFLVSRRVKERALTLSALPPTLLFLEVKERNSPCFFFFQLCPSKQTSNRVSTMPLSLLGLPNERMELWF